jgi:hypothetical protein
VPFTSVSCTSPTFCLAVGTTLRGTAPAIWSGSSWTPTTTITGMGDDGTLLNSVSCTDSTDCVAVGQIYKEHHGTTPWAETWDGSIWSDPHTPSPGHQDTLSAVFCPATGICMAAGYYFAGKTGRRDQTLIESGTAPVPATINKVKPLSGHVGTRMAIDRSGLAGATAVMFNGTAAVIVSDSDSKLVTKVTAGATTGYIDVTTDGTTPSPKLFTVTPSA